MQCSLYLRKLPHVSALCRLTVPQELVLLRQCEARAALGNRRQLLQHLQRSGKSGSVKIPLVHPPAHKTGLNFDKVVDKTAVDPNAFTSLLSKLQVWRYQRPIDKDDAATELTGVAALNKLNTWMKKGMSLAGINSGLGFPFFYELLSASLSIRICETDTPFALGRVLLRLLPARESVLAGDIFMSILR